MHVIKHRGRGAWPAADPTSRREWRTRRDAMEGTGRASTPSGVRPNFGGNLLAAITEGVHDATRWTGIPKRLRNVPAVRACEISIEDLPRRFEGYTVLHLSDPHFGRDAARDEVATCLAGTTVDLCVVTGDFCSTHRSDYVEAALLEGIDGLRQAIATRDGVLAVLGNHDAGALVDTLESTGIRVLVNEAAVLHEGMDELWIVGIDDPHYFYSPAATAALAAFEPGPSRCGLALVHTPELASEAAAAGYSLYLCGHTHGGQICLPGGRPIITQLWRHHRLARGEWRLGGMQGYTSTGLGTSGLPLRLFCPAEAVILTLRRAGAIEPAAR